MNRKIKLETLVEVKSESSQFFGTVTGIVHRRTGISYEVTAGDGTIHHAVSDKQIVGVYKPMATAARKTASPKAKGEKKAAAKKLPFSSEAQASGQTVQ